MRPSDSKRNTSTSSNSASGLAGVGHLLNKAAVLAVSGTKWLGIIALIGMMGLITVDVILRNTVGKPILGSYELIQFLMVITIFFAVPYTAIHDGHVTVDLVYERFPPKMRSVIDFLANLFSLGLFILICWQSVVQGFYIYQSKQVTLALGIPIFGLLFIVALGCALLCLVLVSNLMQILANGSKK